MTAHWNETEIAAWVDGSADAADAERIERIVAADPAARAYAEALQKTNRALKTAFETPMDEPIPAAIKAAVLGEPGKVAQFPKRRRAAAWVPAAIAASLALVVGLGAGGLLQTESAPGTIAALGDAPTGGPLHAALETLPSGTESADGVRPMLSFYDGDGRACREFEVAGELPQALEFGIACRTPAGAWHVEIVVAAPAGETNPEGIYVPASGPASDALDAMLDALDAGLPLTPDDEADLLEAGWDGPAG